MVLGWDMGKNFDWNYMCILKIRSWIFVFYYFNITHKDNYMLFEYSTSFTNLFFSVLCLHTLYTRIVCLFFLVSTKTSLLLGLELSISKGCFLLLFSCEFPMTLQKEHNLGSISYSISTHKENHILLIRIL